MFPEYQQRLFEEITSVLPNASAEITKEDLKQMPYLDMFIKETLRLFPAVPFLTRRVTKDTEIGKLFNFSR